MRRLHGATDTGQQWSRQLAHHHFDTDVLGRLLVFRSLDGFGILFLPDVAAYHAGVVSYRNNFSKATTSKAKSRPSTRSLKSNSIQHLRSEITAATLTGLPLFFRLPTRNSRSTLKASSVYTEVA